MFDQRPIRAARAISVTDDAESTRESGARRSGTTEAMVVTSTPARRRATSDIAADAKVGDRDRGKRSVAALHPALRQLGPRGPRYLRRAHRRRQRELTRRSATVLLVCGVVIAGPMLAITSGPDAAASRSVPVASHRIRSGAKRSPTTVRQISGGEAFVAAPQSTIAPITHRFAGAYAARSGERRWIAYPANRMQSFLFCTRSYESDTAGGYHAVSRDGRHRGAYQFKVSTWNTVARHVGRRDLVGVDPARARQADQDWMALYLYKWLGASHWEGRCAGK